MIAFWIRAAKWTPRSHCLVLVGFEGFTLLSCRRGTATNPGRSNWYRRVFRIERRFEKARGNRGLSSPKPLIVVYRKD
jgi:hypothetical protein